MTHGGLFMTKYVYHKQISAVEFSVSLICSSITDAIEASIKQSYTGGGRHFKNSFYKDMSFYLMNVADPVHDFGKLGIRTQTQTSNPNPRIIPYVNKSESEILATLLHDTNVPHGISVKFTRFYTTDSPNSIWREIDDGFNMLGGEHAQKFCIWNSSISNTGGSEFDTTYSKIVPLSVRWDSLPTRSINFLIGTTQFQSDTFYKKVYNGIFDTLYKSTGIRVLLQEHRQTAQTSAIKLTIIVNDEELSVIFDDNGFSKTDITRAIDIIYGKDALDSLDIDVSKPRINALKNILAFLSTRVPQDALVSFLLTCKMSGDVGCVKCVKQLSLKGIPVLYNGELQQTAVRNKPIVFLYTCDKLCAANGILNDIKCVFKHNYQGKSYYAQYMSSIYSFNINQFITPYMIDLETACSLVQTCRFDMLISMGLVQFVHTLYTETFSRVLSVRPTAKDIKDSDEFVKCVVALSALVKIETSLDHQLKSIIKGVEQKFVSEYHLISLEYLHSLYVHKKMLRFFDPLISYLNKCLLMPNDTDQKTVYMYTRHKIHTKMKILLSDSFAALQSILAVSDASSDEEDNFQDDAMLDIATPTAKSKPKRTAKN